ncbi:MULTISPECIES: chain-length determining protein [unclassified Novosphingobium]|uniref:chain-length determining protein n=1 Tax=unclassified Novosphingobium TaxID=2644732 RepID=UPI0014421506|nr:MULTISPECIES: chain-length determining protein [unclassified Novosphingobium]MBB3359329.1 capsular polysaccharide transport system permease protein [Novosphingobium sp. BK256]MBB3375689.1 capsular polysaccharide transport system permease protein [Novosphingobium sp. BK280]MBB3380102.1 capsular polysaccharide transport system permease protein [Novosphingobium sp. BK258]MBB3421796.1 capsular polysaccharide transport system permease protein [Novosphingobium sp. BK267]MBB3450452.1 capsular poly
MSTDLAYPPASPAPAAPIARRRRPPADLPEQGDGQDAGPGEAPALPLSGPREAPGATTLPAAGRPRWRAARIRHLVLGLAGAASLVASAYWCLIASDLYVSETDVVVQRADMGAIDPGGLGGLLSGLAGAGGGNRNDQMLLRNHLLSQDMLARLDARLHLRAHYADHRHDWLSRLGAANAPMARFRDYMKARVRVDYDDNAGVLHVEASAYDPATAQAIVAAMLHEGAAFMNANDHRLAQTQVDFLASEAAQMGKRNQQARQAVLDFQSREGMVSPDGTLDAVAGTIAQLEARKSALQTQLGTLEAYLVSAHPDVVAVRQQIGAIDAELARERARAAAPEPGALNRRADAFRQLQQEAQFSQSLYQTTLAALEKGRITAMQAMKQISVVQAPTLPEYPARPRRLYNALVFTLAAFLAAAIALLLVSVVRDHVD